MSETLRMEVTACRDCPWCMGDRSGSAWCAFTHGGTWILLSTIEKAPAACPLRRAAMLVVLRDTESAPRAESEET